MQVALERKRSVLERCLERSKRRREAIFPEVSPFEFGDVTLVSEKHVDRFSQMLFFFATRLLSG